MDVDSDYWPGRRVLVTGHTGFKGAWLSLWLTQLGAEVTGLSQEVPTTPSLFAAAGVADGITDLRADVRDLAAVQEAVRRATPEIIFHMAAQPFVRRSFADPVGTYATNVMGTVHMLEAARATDSVRAVVNITSDKCYDNREQQRPFVETDCMGGHDPYSNSKGCAELVADAFRRSYEMPVASVRAGNVIGGGDWGEDRLIPDLIAGAAAGTRTPIRNPDAVRPWQHVLNPLSGYLLIAERLAKGDGVAEGWNFGPDPQDVRPVRWIADRFTELWPGGAVWDLDDGPHPHEAGYLSLDSTKARTRLGWRPRWDLEETLRRIVEWHLALRDGGDMRALTLRQIETFSAA